MLNLISRFKIIVQLETLIYTYINFNIINIKFDVRKMEVAGVSCEKRFLSDNECGCEEFKDCQAASTKIS